MASVFVFPHQREFGTGGQGRLCQTTLYLLYALPLRQGWANFLAQGPHLVFKTDRRAGPLVDEDHNV